MNYYNEFDPKAAQWLRNLVAAGLIPQGVVDERSIKEVEPDELKRYTQCHFFAGIGGWSYALQLADWSEDRPVWTGICPCQPFSTAGKQKGKADERHLWPVWFRLIRECRPPVVFGEQVAAAVTHEWLDEVSTDLESENYAIGSAIIPACGVGSPHKRDRLWFVADARSEKPFGLSETKEREKKISIGCERDITCDVANPDNQRLQGHGGFVKQHDQAGWQEQTGLFAEAGFWHGEWIVCPDGKQRLIEPSIRLLAHGVSGRMAVQRTNECGEAEVHWYNRVAALKAFGNAIVPQVAAEFIKAYMEQTK